MATTTTQQYVSEDPRFIAYKEGLLQDASDFVRGQFGFNQVPVTDAQGQPVLNEQGQPTFKLEPIRRPSNRTTDWSCLRSRSICSGIIHT
jgi:hypothetical protein